MSLTTESGDGYQRSTKEVLNGLVDDLATIKAAYAVLIAKLNADAGITDTDYAVVGTLSVSKG